MKISLLFFSLLLLPFLGNAQQYADKEYYLVDSLDLNTLTKAKHQLVDSCLKLYHNSKHDTSKINAISIITEGDRDYNIWPKYNEWLYELVKEKIQKTKSKQITKHLKNVLAGTLCNKGLIHFEKGDNALALEYYKKSILLEEGLGNKQVLAVIYNNIGNVYQLQGDIPLALNYHQKSLKLREAVGDKNGMAESYSNIGYVHQSQDDMSVALKYYKKSLKLEEGMGDKQGMSASYNNIGSIHRKQGNLSLALQYYKKCLSIDTEMHDKYGMATSYNNIGYVYKIQDSITLALDYYQKSLKLYQELRDKFGITVLNINIGTLKLRQGNLLDAKPFGQKGFQLAQELGFPFGLSKSAFLLSEIAQKQGKDQEALEMYKLHIQMRDSINNEKNQKASIQQQTKYEYEKQKALDDAEHEKEIAIEHEAKEKQQIMTYATAGGLGLVAIFLLFVFNRLKVTRKQKGLIEDAHEELEEKNTEILDSINYAKRIQSAILPPNRLVKEYLPNSFILYQPKDIVAGDFYWMEHKEGRVLFAAADCTGHGVPGAMVSVVCNNGLNRSVREYGLMDPGEILDKTREIVIQEFEKSEEEVKDGMDIALCSLKENTLQYAGANNSLVIIKKGTTDLENIQEIKADKQPIGKYAELKSFTTHTIQLNKGDCFYIFSDGYPDQFGGPKGKKFMYKPFRRLLLENCTKPMEEQRNILTKTFKEWRGDLEQVDDVCVIGVRL